MGFAEYSFWYNMCGVVGGRCMIKDRRQKGVGVVCNTLGVGFGLMSSVSKVRDSRRSV